MNEIIIEHQIVPIVLWMDNHMNEIIIEYEFAMFDV